MARRAFLHVGTAKSGTSYLQDLWWRHRDALRERGLLLPGDTTRDHFHAAALVKGMDAIVERLDDERRGTWERLVAETRDWSGDVLISHEHFSDSPADAAARALADLAAAADEVHLVLTVRDLGAGAALGLAAAGQAGGPPALRRVPRDRAPRARTTRSSGATRTCPASSTAGRSGSIPPTCTSSSYLPPGAPRDELWRRTGAVLGVDVGDLDTEARRTNVSLGIVEAELLRRVNAHIPRERRTVDADPPHPRRLHARPPRRQRPPEPFVLPAEHAGWVRERSEAVVATLRERSYDVVGDLDDLRPADPGPGRTPDEVSDAEVLAAATTVVARMVERWDVEPPGAEPLEEFIAARAAGPPRAARTPSARDERPVVQVEQHPVGVLPVVAAQRHRLVAAAGRDQPQAQGTHARGVHLGRCRAPPTRRGPCRRRTPGRRASRR